MIKKALVELAAAPFQHYTSMRAVWGIQDWCRSPGPIQFYGPSSNMGTITLALEVRGEEEGGGRRGRQGERRGSPVMLHS